MSLTTEEMIRKYLEENGYDGLCNPDLECGCEIEDLFPCGGEGISDCRAGNKTDCNCGNGCDFHIEDGEKNDDES